MDALQRLIAEQSRWAAYIERLQAPERGAMRFMCETYRALDAAAGHEGLAALLEDHERLHHSFARFEEALGNTNLVVLASQGALYDVLRCLPSNAPELLARDYDVPMKVVAEWLDTSAKTLSRRDKISLLSRTESDVALRYGRVFEQAKEAFGTEDAARQWLTEAQPSLGGAVPVELLRSELGARQVERVVRLIDYGDYI